MLFGSLPKHPFPAPSRPARAQLCCCWSPLRDVSSPGRLEDAWTTSSRSLLPDGDGGTGGSSRRCRRALRGTPRTPGRTTPLTTPRRATKWHLAGTSEVASTHPPAPSVPTATPLRRPGPLPSAPRHATATQAAVGTRRTPGAAVRWTGKAQRSAGMLVLRGPGPRCRRTWSVSRRRARLLPQRRTRVPPHFWVPTLAKSGRQIRSDMSLSPSARARITGRCQDRWRQSSLPTESRRGHLALLLLEDLDRHLVQPQKWHSSR